MGPFAKCKSINKQKSIIEEFSFELIKRDERFCIAAIGWVLREYSKIDAGFVRRLLNEYENWTDKVVIKLDT